MNNVFLGVVDGWLLGTGLGYESDSVEEHGSEPDAVQTALRSDDIAGWGLQLLHRGPKSFRDDPQAWARTVLRAAAARKGREPDGLTVVPRGPVLPATPEQMLQFRTGRLAGRPAADE